MHRFPRSKSFSPSARTICRRQIVFLVGLHRFPDGKSFSPSACTVSQTANHFPHRLAPFPRWQIVFPIGLHRFPGGKSFSPSACTVSQAANRFPRRHAPFPRRQIVFPAGLHRSPDGKSFSPSAYTISEPANRFPRRHTPFPSRQIVFPAGVHQFPGDLCAKPLILKKCDNRSPGRDRVSKLSLLVLVNDSARRGRAIGVVPVPIVTPFFPSAATASLVIKTGGPTDLDVSSTPTLRCACRREGFA